MYATCLFCNSALGNNECLEHFPVGRRIAFDAAVGRLWAICEQCKRWNLSPLETRWEAIEEAERAFRATRIRVSTDNIGLCRLSEGTELVRIGKPLRPEFAAWRYGNQFLQRKRKFILGTTAKTAGLISIPVIAAQALWMNAGLSATMLTVAALMGTGASIGGARAVARDAAHSLSLRGSNDELLFLSRNDARSATLSPAAHAFEWQLNVPSMEMEFGGAVARMMGIKAQQVGHRMNYLRDDVAKRALAVMLPSVNLFGGGKTQLKDAIDLLDDAPSAHYLLHRASVTESRWKAFNDGFRQANLRRMRRSLSGWQSGRLPNVAFNSRPSNEIALGELPSGMRLALEMSMHEDDERRAMEGELKELEERWRDADEIARIADAMFVPDRVEHEVERMKSGPQS